MTPHKAWVLAGRQARRVINSRFGTHVEAVHIAHEGSTHSGFRLDGKELFINPPYVRDANYPPPLGPMGEPQYQLQQPELVGTLIYLFSHCAHSPWRKKVEAGSTPNEDHMTAAQKLDQLRAELAEIRKRPFARIPLGAFLAVYLRDKQKPQHKLHDDEVAAYLLDLYLLGLYARMRLGIIRVHDTRRSLRDTQRYLADTVGEATLAKLNAIVDGVGKATGDNPAEMLHYGQHWRDAMEGIDLIELDAEELYDRLHALINSLDHENGEEVHTLQLAYPPTVAPIRKKHTPLNMREWANQLSDEQDDGQGDYPDFPNFEGDGGDDPEDDSRLAGLGIPASRHVEYRNPTEREQRQAIDLANTLKRLRYRRPNGALKGVQTPGGRLDTRQLVQMTAQRARGTTVTATPWQRRYAAPSEQPGLTGAIVLDTSASMGMVRQAILSLNWVFAQAVTTVGGTISTWGFGGDTFELIRANTRPVKVPVAVDSGSTSEGAALALARAADAVKLEECAGARVAVVVTDSALDQGRGNGEESQALNAVFADLKKAGVTTLLLQVGPGGASAITSAKIINGGMDSQTMAQVLEHEIIEAYMEA